MSVCTRSCIDTRVHMRNVLRAYIYACKYACVRWCMRAHKQYISHVSISGNKIVTEMLKIMKIANRITKDPVC